MITLISSIIGLLTSFAPSLFSIYSKQQDYSYELEITKLQIDSATKNLDIQKQIAEIQANNSDEISVRNNDSSVVDDHTFIGKLRSSVRPVITYFFFFLFVVLKSLVAYDLMSHAADPKLILDTVWDQNTMTIFSAIISFWFGSKAMENINFSRPITGITVTPTTTNTQLVANTPTTDTNSSDTPPATPDDNSTGG